MTSRIVGIALAAALAFPCVAGAATLEELQRYDKNKNGRLDGDEILIYQSHQANPILAKYDTDNKGYLNPEQLKRAQAEIRRLAMPQKLPKATPANAQDVFKRGVEQLNARNGGIPLEDLAEKPKTLPNPCASSTPQLFIRKDSMDTFLYGITPVSKAQGASVSYTNNYLVQGQRTAQIDGQVSLLVFRKPCIDPPKGVAPGEQLYLSGFALAPWVSGHGNLNDQNRNSEKNALKVGLDTQFDVTDGKLFDVSYFSGTPYWQTDFRGYARAAGYSAYWEPTRLDIRLGGNYARFSEIVDWYWRFRAEANIRNVQDPGETGLATGNHEWFGFTSQLYLFFLPGDLNVPDYLRDRFSITGTFTYFSNAQTGESYNQYNAQAAYNLSTDGSTSVAVQYIRGTDKDTLTPTRQFLFKLNYKY
jgi:hypothetical protein